MKVIPIDRAMALPAVERIARLYKACPVMDVACLGGGPFSIVYRTDFEDYERWVIKIYKAEEIHEREAGALNLLKAACRVRVPKLYFIHTATKEIPFDAIGMEYIDGVSADKLNPYLMCPKKKRAFAEDVTAEIAHMHGMVNAAFGYPDNAIFSSWGGFYNLVLEDTLEKAERLVVKGELDQFTFNLVKTGGMKLDYIFKDAPAEAAFIHSDLSVKNMMADERTKKLTAFIDPFHTLWGDAEYELFQLKKFTGPQFKLYETYKKNNRVTDYVDLKTALYGLTRAVIDFTETGRKSDKEIKFLGKKLEKQYKMHGLR